MANELEHAFHIFKASDGTALMFSDPSPEEWMLVQFNGLVEIAFFTGTRKDAVRLYRLLGGSNHHWLNKE